jgi:hypothetical protein
MKRLTILVVLLVLGLSGAAEAKRSAVHGSVKDPRGDFTPPFQGPGADLKRFGIRYDSEAGSLELTWTLWDRFDLLNRPVGGALIECDPVDILIFDGGVPTLVGDQVIFGHVEELERKRVVYRWRDDALQGLTCTRALTSVQSNRGPDASNDSADPAVLK